MIIGKPKESTRRQITSRISTKEKKEIAKNLRIHKTRRVGPTGPMIENEQREAEEEEAVEVTRMTIRTIEIIGTSRGKKKSK